MQKTQGKYERAILIAMALLAFAAGGWFIWSTMNFPDTLKRQQANEKAFTGDIPVDRLERATALAASDPVAWNAPVRSNKPVPLFKSVLLLIKYEQPDALIDMFTEDVKIRDPMTNKWLRENNFPKIPLGGVEYNAYLIPNIGDLDADGDGFTNREEFDKGTSPTDAKDHPAITEKLYLVERIAHNFRLTLKSASAPFQIATPEDKQKKNWFVNEGERFGAGGRFTAGKFEKKVVPDARVGEKDVSELEVEDTVRKSKFKIVMGTETNLAEYGAVFEFRLKVIERLNEVMKGDNFRIPSQPDTTYKLVDIQEDSAVISPLNPQGQPEKEIIIKKN